METIDLTITFKIDRPLDIRFFSAFHYYFKAYLSYLLTQKDKDIIKKTAEELAIHINSYENLNLAHLTMLVQEKFGQNINFYPFYPSGFMFSFFKMKNPEVLIKTCYTSSIEEHIQIIFEKNIGTFLKGLVLIALGTICHKLIKHELISFELCALVYLNLK